MGLLNKDVKRRFYRSQVTDYIHLRRYFEEMAAKGWMVTTYNGSSATFEACEPVALDFDVVIYQPSNPNNVAYTNSVIELKERVIAKGWSYCMSQRQFSVFYKKKGVEALPIYDDEGSRYKDVKKAYWKTESGLVVMLLFIIAITVLNNCIIRIDSYLTNSTWMINVIMINCILSLLLVIIPQWLWLIRNRQKIKKDEALVHCSLFGYGFRNRIFMVSITMVGLGLVFYTSSLSGKGTSPYEGIVAFIPTMLGVTIGSVIGSIIRDDRSGLCGFLACIVTFGAITSGSLLVSSLNAGITELDSQEKEVAFISERVPFITSEDNDTGHYFPRIQSSYYAPINFEVYLSRESEKETQIKYVKYIEARDLKTADRLMEQILEDAKRQRDIDIVAVESMEERAYYLSEDKEYVVIQMDKRLMTVELNGDLSDRGFTRKVMNQLFVDYQLTAPPELRIEVGLHSYEACRGGYTWTINKGDGSYTTINADSAGIKEIAKRCVPIELLSEDRFILEFGIEPISYEIHTWKPNDEEVYEGYDDSNVVYEVKATWSQGQARYVFIISEG